jgi:hypothetical protein
VASASLVEWTRCARREQEPAEARDRPSARGGRSFERRRSRATRGRWDGSCARKRWRRRPASRGSRRRRRGRGSCRRRERGGGGDVAGDSAAGGSAEGDAAWWAYPTSRGSRRVRTSLTGSTPGGSQVTAVIASGGGNMDVRIEAAALKSSTARASSSSSDAVSPARRSHLSASSDAPLDQSAVAVDRAQRTSSLSSGRAAGWS